MRALQLGILTVCLGAPVCLPAKDLELGLLAIDMDRIARDVKELASDAYMGRSCPTPGYMRAAEYVQARFRELGLTPGGTDPQGENPYFRYWQQDATLPDLSSRLVLSSDGARQEFQLEADWIPLAGCKEGSVTGALSFVGYAISASKWHYKDLDRINLKGRVAVAFWHEPRENVKGSRFDGPEWTLHASAHEKAKLVEKLGALALILVNDPLHEPAQRPPLFQFPRLAGWNGGPRDKAPEFPVIFVSLEAGEALTGMDLRAEHARIDKTLKSKSQHLEGRSVELEVHFKQEKVLIPNVIGVAEGRLDSEGAVVVAAHLDHAGADDGGRIWNGADDNASGSAALMAVAAAFAKAPSQRDTILIAMAAEEWGLWGSDAYALNPLVPLERTDFMLNIDMVGRGPTTEFAVLGAWDSAELKKLIQSSSKLAGGRLKIDTSGGREYWERSDQYNFFKHGVPALFVSEVGIEHADYHKPSDTADKIDFKKATHAAKLAYAIAWSVGELETALPRVPTDKR